MSGWRRRLGLSALRSLLGDERGLLGIGGTAGFALAGSNVVEATTTSTTTVDIVTVSSLSIPVTVPFSVLIAYRKTTGAAAAAFYSSKLNATDVGPGNAITSTTNEAEDGALTITFPPQEGTNYTHGAIGLAAHHQSATLYDVTENNLAATPNATLTSFTFRGSVGSALITLGMKNGFVWTLPTS